MNLQVLRDRREQLIQGLRETAIQLEQIRGALGLCEQLITECEGNGHDLQAASADQREDGKPVE